MLGRDWFGLDSAACCAANVQTEWYFMTSKHTCVTCFNTGTTSAGKTSSTAGKAKVQLLYSGCLLVETSYPSLYVKMTV